MSQGSFQTVNKQHCRPKLKSQEQRTSASLPIFSLFLQVIVLFTYSKVVKTKGEDQALT